MLGKHSVRKFITSITVSAVLCVYSTIAFAIPSTSTGELTVIGQVTVNGQPAVSSSTILSGETITSAADSTATLSLGKAGTVRLEPNSSVVLSFSESTINGRLSTGGFTVLNSAQNVNISTAAGQNLVLKAGDTVNAEGVTTSAGADHRDASGKCIDDNNDGKFECDSKKAAWLPWVLIFGGATAGLIWATHDSNKADLSGAAVIVSPTR